LPKRWDRGEKRKRRNLEESSEREKGGVEDKEGGVKDNNYLKGYTVRFAG
jgi:hypothetical protein